MNLKEIINNDERIKKLKDLKTRGLINEMSFQRVLNNILISYRLKVDKRVLLMKQNCLRW